MRTKAVLICLCLLLQASHSLAQSEPTSTSGGSLSSTRGLGRIATGTLVGKPEQARWNTVVLLARPRLASGDVSAIPSMFRDVASSFVLTILATVEPYAVTGETRYRLAELGFGFSKDVDGELTVISSTDYDQVGVKLGMVEQRVLSRNEKQLDLARLVARTSTLTMFDVPAILVWNGDHQDFVIRHFVWIDAGTGRSSALVWLLQRDAQQRLTVVDEPIKLVRSGTKEDRRIHVDSSEFILGGIPTERSFALESLPPGDVIPWTFEARQVAAHTVYDAQSMQALTTALNAALQSVRMTSRAQGADAR